MKKAIFSVLIWGLAISMFASVPTKLSGGSASAAISIIPLTAFIKGSLFIVADGRDEGMTEVLADFAASLKARGVTGGNISLKKRAIPIHGGGGDKYIYFYGSGEIITERGPATVTGYGRAINDERAALKKAITAFIKGVELGIKFP